MDLSAGNGFVMSDYAVLDSNSKIKDSSLFGSTVQSWSTNLKLLSASTHKIGGFGKL